MRRTTLLRILAALSVAAAIAAPAATASQLIGRNATGISLATNSKGEALVTAKIGGKVQHILVWGAINARTPKRGAHQVSFKVDYTGGYGKYRNASYWKTFGGGCGAYDGPALAWKVAACKATDGTYWSLQAWQRALPDYGLQPARAQSAWELRISHWSGPIATLDITTDWSYRKYDQIFGTYSYAGEGVYGFSSTSAGNPLDSFGRNIYVDTLDSAYGSGWKRDNSFLTHQAKGSFCYGFYPHGSHPAGNGKQYRATAEGPGVTPDVMWQGTAPGTYQSGLDQDANAQIAALGDSHCRPN